MNVLTCKAFFSKIKHMKTKRRELKLARWNTSGQAIIPEWKTQVDCLQFTYVALKATLQRVSCLLQRDWCPEHGEQISLLAHWLWGIWGEEKSRCKVPACLPLNLNFILAYQQYEFYLPTGITDLHVTDKTQILEFNITISIVYSVIC